MAGPYVLCERCIAVSRPIVIVDRKRYVKIDLRYVQIILLTILS